MEGLKNENWKEEKTEKSEKLEINSGANSEEWGEGDKGAEFRMW